MKMDIHELYRVIKKAIPQADLIMLKTNSNQLSLRTNSKSDISVELLDEQQQVSIQENFVEIEDLLSLLKTVKSLLDET